MATKRSTHDVKAQRGLGRGLSREEKEKSLRAATAPALFCGNEDQTKWKGTECVGTRNLRLRHEGAVCTAQRKPSHWHSSGPLHGSPDRGTNISRPKPTKKQQKMQEASSAFRLSQLFTNSTARHTQCRQMSKQASCSGKLKLSSSGEKQALSPHLHPRSGWPSTVSPTSFLVFLKILTKTPLIELKD